MASSVFDDFPPRRMMSMVDPASSFGSLHRHRQPPPSWMNDGRSGSKESSPARSDSGGSLPSRHSAFHRADSIPMHVTHELSRHGSRSSTPESTGSGSRPSSLNDYQTQNHVYQEGDVSATSAADGVEEHPMATSRAGKQGFTARHQPKVHHIPIHVEPRDGPQPQQQTLTPPISGETMPFHVVHEQSPPPPVIQQLHQQEPRRSSFPSDQPILHKRASQHKAHVPAQAQQQQQQPQRHPSNVPKPMSGGGWEIPVQRETTPPQQPQSQEQAVPQPQKEQQSEPTEPEAPAQPVVKPMKKTPFEVLDEVQADVTKLKEDVIAFKGSKGDKAYLYLDEMLTRNLIRLDNIETEGNEELRRARRAVITSINECISTLEHVASGNDVATAAASAQDAGEEQEEQQQATLADEMDTKVEDDVALVQNDVPMSTEEGSCDAEDVPATDEAEADAEASETVETLENHETVDDVSAEVVGQDMDGPHVTQEQEPDVQEADDEEPMECQEGAAVAVAESHKPDSEATEAQTTVDERVSTANEVAGIEEPKEVCLPSPQVPTDEVAC